MEIKTYEVAVNLKYGQPGYDDALAAATAINRGIADSGESSFISGDDLADYSACKAIRREIDSCDEYIRGDLRIETYFSDIEE